MKNRIQQWLQIKRYNWRNIDISLIVIVLVLAIISSYVISIVNPAISMKKQLIGVFGGLIIIAIFSLIDYHDLCLYIPIIYIVATLMAAATRLSPLGDDKTTGSYRWLDFKIISFQDRKSVV